MTLRVREYQPANGKNPFREWLATLDGAVREARLMLGSGCRIYFGLEGKTLLLLLVGGTKASQARDIRRAQRFWHDYLEGQ